MWELADSTPLMILTLFLLYFTPMQDLVETIFYDDSGKYLEEMHKQFQKILTGLMITSFSISVVTFGKWGALTIQKDFRFYLAKASFELSLKIPRPRSKIRYAIFGLYSYNKYLSRHMDSHINNLENIFQQIISDEQEKMDKKLEKIVELLKNNKLDLLRYLADLPSSKKDEKFLVKMTPREKIVNAGPIIAIIFSMIAFISENVASNFIK